LVWSLFESGSDPVKTGGVEVPKEAMGCYTTHDTFAGQALAMLRGRRTAIRFEALPSEETKETSSIENVGCVRQDAAHIHFV
jgi:hypothetical protein